MANFVFSLQKAVGVKQPEVRLFGSRARGESSAESDYDAWVVADSDYAGGTDWSRARRQQIERLSVARHPAAIAHRHLLGYRSVWRV